MRVLGTMYLNGEGVEKDLRRAEYWWGLAIARGNVFAMRSYGLAMANARFGVARVPHGIGLLIAAFARANCLALKEGSSRGIHFQ